MKLIFKILLISLFLSLIFMGLISCGARKSNVEKQKEETKTELKDNSVSEKQSESNVKTDTTTKIDDKNETVTEETIFEPADKSKESFIIEKDGTKTVLNNIKKTIKKTTRKNNTSVSSKMETTEKQNKAVKEQKKINNTDTSKKEIKAKEVDKKQFNPINFIWIGSLLFLLVYVIYRIYKKLPLVPKF